MNVLQTMETVMTKLLVPMAMVIIAVRAIPPTRVMDITAFKVSVHTHHTLTQTFGWWCMFRNIQH